MTEIKPTPKVGDTLYSLNIGNAARRTPQKLTPVQVVHVGRKYFTVDLGYQRTVYHIEDWSEKTEYSADSQLFASEQEWKDESERSQLWERLRKVFSSYSPGPLTLETLRKIHEYLCHSATK